MTAIIPRSTCIEQPKKSRRRRRAPSGGLTSAPRSSAMADMGQLRAGTFVAAVAAALLAAFVVVESLRVPLLIEPEPRIDTVSVAAAGLGLSLLVLDAVLPVPSSAVMIALGATFGPVGGLVLSVVGSV